jgi:hypothetical protein
MILLFTLIFSIVLAGVFAGIFHLLSAGVPVPVVVLLGVIVFVVLV